MARRVRSCSTMPEDTKFNVLNPGAAYGSGENKPASLQQHCRVFILQAVGLKRLSRIAELPLPRTMIQFLANQLSVDDFYINKNDLNGDHMSHCVYPAKCLLDMSDVLLKCVPQCLKSEQVMRLVEKWTHLRHPNLQPYLISFTQSETEIIVFDYAPYALHDILRSLTQEGKTIPEYLIWKLFGELCDVIKYLESNEIEYPELKTKSLSLTDDGNLKLESGLLYGTEERDPMQAMAMDDTGICGVYVSPESIKGEETTWRTQVWVLGCILYEMATLVPAYAMTASNMFGAMSAIMEGRSPAPVSDTYSMDLRSTISDCLKSDQHSRPTTDELLGFAKARAENLKEEYNGPSIVNL